MSQVREPAFDRAVGLVLGIGAVCCFLVMLTGLISALFTTSTLPLRIERVGVLLMLATRGSRGRCLLPVFPGKR